MNATKLDASDPISRLAACPSCQRDVFVLDGDAMLTLPRASVERAHGNGVYDFSYDALVGVFATKRHQCQGAKK